MQIIICIGFNHLYLHNVSKSQFLFFVNYKIVDDVRYERP